MDTEEMINKISENGRLEDMEELSEILEDLMEIIKEYDIECFKKYEMKLYKLAYGATFTPEMAEKIVRKMRPYGMRWSMEETESVQRQRGTQDIDPSSFFIVLNSAYNDYKDIFGEDLEGYIKFTIDFIKDEDAKPDKVFNYFI